MKRLIIFSVLFAFLSVCIFSQPTEKVYSPDGKGYRYEQNGWIYIHIEGKPFERGFQHGYLIADQLEDIKRSLEYLTYWDSGMTWDFFVEKAAEMWSGHIDEELRQEMQGIAAGASYAGVSYTWEEIMAWNGYEELMDYWWPTELEETYGKIHPGADDHCSAFMAVGSPTDGGKIVMAHNSFNNFEWGQFANVILDIVPETGYRMFMQSQAGYIHSMSDFFVTGAKLMGTETTIGGFKVYDASGAPEFYRIRKAMQYTDTLDDFVGVMLEENNGGYANTWLVGDIKTGEIMRFELGLKFYKVDKTKDGYFTGFNAPLDPRIRNLECTNSGFADIRRHQGARQVRLEQLMQEHYSTIDVETGKEILADHYDVYLGKINPSSRTVDSHYELDAREYMSEIGRPLPYRPRGAVDGMVCDSEMAEGFTFWSRWGNSSGMPFDADAFLKEHTQWDYLDGYLQDRPSQAWTLFEAE
ncbi:MAG TPA: C45 family autoproteolytic acyltransferase/hydrolase [Thermotogota bacterium]|nr:C45 family autoproteolytic acyltransferase/hydrolase [Thermotogota bacterium]HPJ89397.1 C45 family autoproteolytic acyltransferase/hydrolase [Thermotogota bacterium]HPR96579.1 C45 family autoproteolytic acyltransferase/hydrolase [Thermotogota bacterium]